MQMNGFHKSFRHFREKLLQKPSLACLVAAGSARVFPECMILLDILFSELTGRLRGAH